MLTSIHIANKKQRK